MEDWFRVVVCSLVVLVSWFFLWYDVYGLVKSVVGEGLVCSAYFVG